MRHFLGFWIVVVFVILGVERAHAEDIGSAVDQAASELGEQLLERDANKIAVVGFSDLNGFESALGDFLSEELVSAFFGLGNFDVLERREMDRIQSETSQYYSSDAFADGNFAELGKMLGVDAIVTGTLTDFGNSVRWNSRAIDIETGRVFAASSNTIDKTDGILDLLTRPSARATVPRDPIEGLVTQPSSVQFRNRWVNVVPKSVIVSPDRNEVRISAEITNISGQEIALLQASRFDAFVSTNTADELDSVELSGIKRTSAYKASEVFERASTGGTILGPGVSQPIVWVIRTKRGNQILGTTLSIKTSLGVTSNAKQEIFQLRLNDIILG